MTGYSVALFFHFIFVIAAVAAATLAGHAAVRLRNVESAAEAGRLGALIGRVRPVFPIATAGLLGSGAYMTQDAWTWSTPWIVSGLTGLGMITLLGAGVEGSRGRAVGAELRSAGLSDRAKRLLRDPLAWSAKLTTWTLMLAVVFVMTTKPAAAVCAAALVAAVIGGVAAAVPFWRAPASATGLISTAAASGAE